MFSVWSSVFVLVVGLSLGKAAPSAAPSATPQDCQSMITLLTLDNTAKFSGRWNLIEGFSDHDDFIYMLNTMNSSWIDFTPSAEDNRTLTMGAYERKNGTCCVDLANVTIVSDITMDIRGDIITSSFNLLSTCVDCLVLNITATACDNTPVHALYILARGRSLKESDLEVFHQQAKCMNFSLPPDFHYDQEQEFCPEDNMETIL